MHVDHVDEATYRAYRALGAAPLRPEILRYLLSRSEASVADVMKQFHLTRNGALVHLRILVAEGMVLTRHSTHPRGSGPITYYRADAEQVAYALDTVVVHVLGSD